MVEDDVYAHLVKNTQELGESASSILRRLLGLNARGGKAQGEIQETFDFLKNPELFMHMNNTQRFLYILSWAYRRDPEKFNQVTVVEGTRRKYFAPNSASLLASGRSVNPRQIPDSPFWVITNNSTAKKFEILSEVFGVLGYDPQDTSAMLLQVLKP